MLRLFNFLLYGCSSCSWEVINTEHIYYENAFEQGQATRYTLQCTECGNIKTRLAR
jgi:DNA-directed RNA polymerase subunit RPC12/RpoP